MILSFKQRFEHKILGGTKIHTIREDKHDRWKAGNKIHFSTGIRTPGYNCFKVAKCTGIQKIEIMWDESGPTVYIGSMPFFYTEKHELGYIPVYGVEQMTMLAKYDGFDLASYFFSWFNKDFKGKIIHWTDFRYDS